MITRRTMLTSSAALLASGAVLDKLAPSPAAAATTEAAPTPLASSTSGGGGVSGGLGQLITPNGSKLPWTMDGNVKVFHLTAEPVKREFAKGMTVNCWGYNGQTPGPTIEAVEGDRVRLLVTNKLAEPTSMHWHGMILPAGMDGVAGLTQPHIQPGETYAYEFTLKQSGVLMYHPHSDEMVQMAMGMQGFFVIHPREALEQAVDKHFLIFLQEWFVPPGAATPYPNVMLDFNLFTFNSRVYPGTAPLVIKQNDRVRMSFANLSMDSHPIHVHGHRWMVVATDGGELPPSARWPEVSVNVPPGTTRTVEFVADNPGDWAMHCHKNHHAMNAMGHGTPNMLGVDQRGVTEKVHKLLPGYMEMGSEGMGDMAEMQMSLPANTLPMMTGEGPFGAIGMGGMFTVMKIRENVDGQKDPGWYSHPEGTVAKKV